MKQRYAPDIRALSMDGQAGEHYNPGLTAVLQPV